MKEKSAHENIYKTYNPDEKVFVRIWKKRGKFAKRYKVLAGTMEKNQNDTYIIKCKLLNSDDFMKAKFRVEDNSDFPKSINAKESGMYK